MSAISSVYDSLIGQITSTLPNHKELANPYFPELNDDLTYEHAYGVAFSGGSDPELIIGCGYSIQRDFEVILTRKIFSGLQMRNNEAVLKRREAEKALFEDQILLIKALLNNNTLGQTIIAIEYQSDNGLEFATSGKSDLIILRSIFSVKYIESIN
jgi:hypothetical protein